MSGCERTSAIVGRLVDGEQLTSADAAHVRECQTCRPAVRRIEAFDSALLVAARSLVKEPMPARLTDPALGVRSGGGMGGVLAAAGVGVALVIAVVLGGQLRQINPQLGSIATPPPVSVFQAESAIAMTLATKGYDCGDDIVDSKASPPARGLVCTPSRSDELMGVIALERDQAGVVRKVTAKALPMDKMDVSFQRQATGLLDLALTTAVADATAADVARSWLEPAVAETHPGGSRALNLAGLHLEFVRDRAGGYLLQVSGVR